jgi:hypothetical protein
LTVETQAMDHIRQLQESQQRALIALLPEIPAKPAHQLMVTSPQHYAIMMDAHERATAQQETILQQIDELDRRAAGQEQALKTQQAQEAAVLLGEKFPEFLDPTKGPELRQKLRSTALALGYSDDQLANTDAQDILAMKQISEWKAKAEKFDTLKAKQMQHVRDGKKLPAISRPGAQTARGTNDSRNYAADRQAMRNGDRDATTRVFSRFVT